MYHYSLLFLCLLGVGGALAVLSPPRPSSMNDIKVGMWPFANDGLVNPPSYYQRYRRAEYPQEKPYFQWWYYYLSDFTNNRYFYISFNVMETTNSSSDFKFGLGFGSVDVNTGEHWQKTEAFPVDVLQVSDYFDLQIVNDGELMYHLEVINNDTYRLYGVMNHTKNVIWSDGIAPDTVISFDVTLTRINGWYGQQDLETYQRDLAGGEIAWNTYTHNSLVEGTVNVGGEMYYYNHSAQYRAYGDMNWGERFPAGPKISEGIDYPWGWYTVNVPNEDPVQDLAIVVGTGASTYSVLGKIWAGFADFHFNQTHLGIRQVLAWDGTFFDAKIVSTSSDGELKLFNNSASNFVTYTDNLYNFSVPLQQTVNVITTHYSITLDYTTTLDKINRLMYTDGENYFSDFEALGSTVHVIIDYINDNGDQSNMYDFVSQTGGIEYGYETLH